MEGCAKFAGDDLGKRCLAEPWRPDEEHMIERLTPRFRGLDKNLQIFPRGFLTGEIRKGQGAQGYACVIVALFGTNESRAGWHRMALSNITARVAFLYTICSRLAILQVTSATVMTIKFAKSESNDVREKLRGRGIDAGYLTYLFCSRSALL